MSLLLLAFVAGFVCLVGLDQQALQFIILYALDDIVRANHLREMRSFTLLLAVSCSSTASPVRS